MGVVPLSPLRLLLRVAPLKACMRALLATGEHRDSPETYTAIYDAVVTSIRKFAPTGSANMKFMGLALESDSDFGCVLLMG